MVTTVEARAVPSSTVSAAHSVGHVGSSAPSFIHQHVQERNIIPSKTSPFSISAQRYVDITRPHIVTAIGLYHQSVCLYRAKKKRCVDTFVDP